jgi:phosphoribosylamine--glycine ligase
MASKGYPYDYNVGFEINGLDSLNIDKDIKVFHSGTKFFNGKIITNGGRVLSVTAKNNTIESAIKKAYEAVRNINFANAYYRTDIGFKALRSKNE